MSDHNAGQVMADDFMCEEEEPIVAVRWWGSYIGEPGQRPDGWAESFEISFHFSLGPHPLSLPGPLIKLYAVDAQEVWEGVDINGDNVYRYDAYLPGGPFQQWFYAWQEAPNVGPDANIGELFIDICKPTGENWGWHEVVGPHPILDFAAMGFGAAHHTLSWQSTSTDMAFELMVIPEPVTMVVLTLGLLPVLLRRKRST